MDMPLRCGRISYTNDLPVYAAFDADEVRCPATLVSGVPTRLNEMLLAGELDVSPISSFFCAEHADEFVVLGGIGIGSRDAVRSIYVISSRPPQELAGLPIAVTKESSTGRNLFATICAERYGFMPVYVDADDPFESYRTDGSPCLVIGDKAIDAHLAAGESRSYDVGALWHDTTDRKMVYAVWAVRRDVAQRRNDEVAALGRALVASELWGRSHRDRVIAAAQAAIPRDPAFYSDYYSTLEYDFDGYAQLGLATFYRLAARHGLLARAPELTMFTKELARV